MPGDRQEMSEFQDTSVANTRMVLELTLPNVVIVAPDKDFFELLYNRSDITDRKHFKHCQRFKLASTFQT